MTRIEDIPSASQSAMQSLLMQARNLTRGKKLRRDIIDGPTSYFEQREAYEQEQLIKRQTTTSISLERKSLPRAAILPSIDAQAIRSSKGKTVGDVDILNKMKLTIH